MLTSSLSPLMDHTMEPSMWTKYLPLAQVPEGAVNMNVGVEFYQALEMIMDQYILMI